MNHRLSWLYVVLAFSLAISFNIFVVSKRFSNPFPPAGVSPISEYAVFDLAGIVTGTRRLFADIAWIQLLQYYGQTDKPVGMEEEIETSWDATKFLFGLRLWRDEHEDEEQCDGHDCQHHGHRHIDDSKDPSRHKRLLSHCLRIVSLDPFFNYVYLYGAGALAWNLERTDEAVELLKKGISELDAYHANFGNDVNEPYWRINLYLSAILYRKSGEFLKMTEVLEKAVRLPECPTIVKSILANIYQKDGKLAQSLQLWIDIYESKDTSYHSHAAAKITELRNIIPLTLPSPRRGEDTKAGGLLSSPRRGED
ncbi:MAG: hypothetical protein A2219_00995 [Elusimicrobia bacterium RIFOXYA2_FULL_50_26]|nr:MAG: hypothetical protein A2219_00995 [Elusimicrobia bacterium RIFOXYA2_FULL_50_26]OGS22706.1 MAG: hypothetical protein A2314_08575 [Elusimicrobia bacterium RIFOXYB2_FULL_50_12]